jgi:hypothetical protein
MQDVTVARLQSTRVQTRLPTPFFKCNVLRESLCGQSKYSLRNTKEKVVVCNLYMSLELCLPTPFPHKRVYLPS